MVGVRLKTETTLWSMTVLPADSKVGSGLPVLSALHGWFGPGDAKVYQPPGGVLVHAPDATSAADPLQQIFGGVMPTKSEATPVRLFGAPLTQMFVLFGPDTGSLLHGLT